MDMFSPARRSEIMSRIRDKNTGPEIIVRRLLWSLGVRYRLHRKDIPGKPDIAFLSRRKLIFVHGCFWHGHSCEDGHRPKSNTGYWNAKIERNVQRDGTHIARLTELGWGVLVVWQCETRDKASLRGRLSGFLSLD
jgi:DNA mismatch endonuclease, patch repair protein